MPPTIRSRAVAMRPHAERRGGEETPIEPLVSNAHGTHTTNTLASLRTRRVRWRWASLGLDLELGPAQLEYPEGDWQADGHDEGRPGYDGLGGRAQRRREEDSRYKKQLERVAGVQDDGKQRRQLLTCERSGCLKAASLTAGRTGPVISAPEARVSASGRRPSTG
eukprot:scaffold3132_cov119-Isochrysis_galbana.AAC.7